MFRLQPITVSPSIDPFSLSSTASPSIDRQYPVLVVKVLINHYYCHSSINTTIASPGIDHHLWLLLLLLLVADLQCSFCSSIYYSACCRNIDLSRTTAKARLLLFLQLKQFSSQIDPVLSLQHTSIAATVSIHYRRSPVLLLLHHLLQCLLFATKG